MFVLVCRSVSVSVSVCMSPLIRKQAISPTPDICWTLLGDYGSALLSNQHHGACVILGMVRLSHYWPTPKALVANHE